MLIIGDGMETAKEITTHRQHIQVVATHTEKELKNLEKQLADKETEIGNRIKKKILEYDGISSDLQVTAVFVGDDIVVNINNYSFRTRYADGDMRMERNPETTCSVSLSLLNNVWDDIEIVLKEEGLLK
jgi:hypothetical protein